MRLYVKLSSWTVDAWDLKMSTRLTLLLCRRVSCAPSPDSAARWSSNPDERHAFSHCHLSQHSLRATVAKDGGLRSCTGRSGFDLDLAVRLLGVTRHMACSFDCRATVFTSMATTFSPRALGREVRFVRIRSSCSSLFRWEKLPWASELHLHFCQQSQ